MDEKKYTFDAESASDDEYNECILTPGNDRRKIICDSKNKSDGIIACVGSIESQYIPDTKLKQVELSHGTGTVIHIDKYNQIYVLTVAHNVRGVERECTQCKTKTLKTKCPNGACNSASKTKKTGTLIKPKDIYFSRRSNDTKTLGQAIETYQVESYELPDKYTKFASPKGGYDISIIVFTCHDKHGINLYGKLCENINLIRDTLFGGNKCVLYIYGYPGSMREKKNKRIYYYLYGMGTSKIDETNSFILTTNVNSNKDYIVNRGIDTTVGQSGSCIYSYNDNDNTSYFIYGVHSGGSQKQQANYGTFFDDDTIQWIKNVFIANNVDITKKCIAIKRENKDSIISQLGEGLNYYGHCKNNGCKVKNKGVIFVRGFAQKINPIDEDFEELIKCPKCNEIFELEGYYLYECDCEIKYKLKGLNMKTEIYKASDNYIQLGNDIQKRISTDAVYEYLKFSIFPKDAL
eukprot:27636_1